MTVSQPLTVLLQDSGSHLSCSFSPAVQIFYEVDENLASSLNLFIITSATNLNRIAPFVRNINQNHHLKALLIRADVDAIWLPQIFDRSNLRTLRHTLIFNQSHETLPQRVINAWDWEAQDQLIANATQIGDRLLVVSCALEKIEVAFNDLPSLKVIPEEERGNFILAEEGSYLYWPQSDIHLDLEALRYVVDPAVKMRMDTEKLMHDQQFGKAIARLRKKHHLKQSDIKGLSERQVSRIEQGGTTRVETLQLFAQAHQMNLNDYLNAVANLMSLYS